MSIITSQQIARYYDQYKTTDVTFNKQVISALGLVAKGVYLKIQDRQLPCVVFSSSMASARVIASLPSSVMLALRQVSNRLALRWCFKLPDKVEPITFFVPCRPSGFIHYAVQGPDVHFVTLEFTQRPPDDLIQILGSLLEANANSQRRKDERIVVTPETQKKLGLETREAALVVEGIVHKCILRDLSFSGAKVVVSGNTTAFADKTVSLKFTRSEQMPEMTLSAVVARVDEVGGRTDILAVSMRYSADPPMGYKLLINSYISTLRRATEETRSPTVSPVQPPELPVAEPSLEIPSEGDPATDDSPKNPKDG
jgi:hypothetical protein